MLLLIIDFLRRTPPHRPCDGDDDDDQVEEEEKEEKEFWFVHNGINFKRVKKYNMLVFNEFKLQSHCVIRRRTFWTGTDDVFS